MVEAAVRTLVELVLDAPQGPPQAPDGAAHALERGPLAAVTGEVTGELLRAGVGRGVLGRGELLGCEVELTLEQHRRQQLDEPVLRAHAVLARDRDEQQPLPAAPTASETGRVRASARPGPGSRRSAS